MNAASKYLVSIIWGKLKGTDRADLFMMVVIRSDTELMPLLLITSLYPRSPPVLWIRWEPDRGSVECGTPQRSDRARIPSQCIRYCGNSEGGHQILFWCHDTDLVNHNKYAQKGERPNTFLTLTLPQIPWPARLMGGGEIDEIGLLVTFYPLCKEFLSFLYAVRNTCIFFCFW